MTAEAIPATTQLLFYLVLALCMAGIKGQHLRRAQKITIASGVNLTSESGSPGFSFGDLQDPVLSAPVFAGNNSILGGFNTRAVPWFGVFDDSSDGFSCGLSLVHGDIAVTAAHCVEEDGRTDFPSHVRIGGGTRSSGTRVRVTQGVIHPEWQGSLVKNPDVAIMKLESFLSNEAVTINSDSNFP